MFLSLRNGRRASTGPPRRTRERAGPHSLLQQLLQRLGYQARLVAAVAAFRLRFVRRPVRPAEVRDVRLLLRGSRAGWRRLRLRFALAVVRRVVEVSAHDVRYLEAQLTSTVLTDRRLQSLCASALAAICSQATLATWKPGSALIRPPVVSSSSSLSPVSASLPLLIVSAPTF
ncbi:hypothetical protein NQ318_014959 [Aromia moschata]|uniref:Uncharacterized protein n=1 Tax=Aromia moschata TaxID=1265417 RepID=A0AAV8YVW7_9CUCU|nr:hypothetical protein NQ318_014959 [Aromia moschata]